MKKNLKTDAKNKNLEELNVLIAQKINDLKKLKLSQKVKKNKNVREYFMLRKNLAVLKTIYRQKELNNG